MSVVPVLLVFLPVIMAATSFLAEKRSNLYHSVGIGVGVCGVMILLIHRPVSLDILGIGGLIQLSYDPTSWLYVLLVCACWVLTLIYSATYIQAHYPASAARFYRLFHLTLCATTFTAFAGSPSALLIGYGATTALIYQLIGLHGSEDDRKMQRTYLLQVILPTIGILFPALLYLVIQTQNASWQDQISLAGLPALAKVLVLFGCTVGVGTNAVFPFHRWLPQSWSTPAPVTVLLHSVAAVNLGAMLLVKIVVYVLGEENVAATTQSFWKGGWLLVLLGLNAVYAAYQAWKTQNIKQRFAYSTVSQVSYTLTALLLGTPLGIQAAFLHMFSHGLAKSLLFFVAGYFRLRLNTVIISEINPYLPNNKWAILYIGFAGLSITGVPFLAGSFGKDLIVITEWTTGHYLEAFLLVVGSFINFLYIYPLVRSLFKQPNASLPRLEPIPLSYRTALGVTALLLLLFAFYYPFLITYIG